MRMNSSSIPKRLFAVALLLAVACILSFGGVAHAATTSPAAQNLPTPSTCITAAPAKQEVPINQLAKAEVTVYCYYPDVDVAWGDGTTSQYPVCQVACPGPGSVSAVFFVPISHTYLKAGDYKPEICLGPATPLPPTVACTSIEIVVEPVVQPQINA